MSDLNSSSLKLKPLFLWYLLSIVAIVADQTTKLWADEVLRQGPIVLTSFFKFDLTYNTGAAFSFLQQAGGWQRWFFSTIAFGVSVALAVWIALIVKRQKPGRQWELCALSLVLGGAIGNLIDRLLYGHVIDFISVHYQHNSFPTFNVADSAICVGAALLIFDMFIVQGKEKKEEPVKDNSAQDDEIDRADADV